MKKFFLITTADYKTWSTDESILFLGEWCKIYSDKEKWEELNSEVVPYSWDNRQQLYKDYIYLDELCEKVLTEITKILNKVHGIQYSKMYWRIIIGPWLCIFIPIIFERFNQVSFALKNYNITSTKVYSCELEDMIPYDMNQFCNFFIADKWNQLIYSSLIKRMGTIAYEIVQEEYKPSKVPKRKVSLKMRLMGAASMIFSRLKKDVFFAEISFSWKDRLKLFFKYGIFVESFHNTDLSGLKTNKESRKWMIDLKSTNDFEKFLFNIIPKQLPKAYLEGFQFINKLNKLKSALIRNPRFIFTSQITYNDWFKFWVAEKKEKGAKLLIAQHGGGYGVAKWFSNEDHELNVADHFFSWGWRDKKSSSVIPLGIWIRNKFEKRNNYRQKNALIVLGTTLRYSYKMYSETVSSQWINYFNDQCIFIRSLSDELRSKLIVKLYPYDFGWNDEKRLKDIFPDVCLANPDRSMSKLSKESRVIISTYNSTTFLETLSKNIPTIIFWDPKFWELRPEAIADFNKLKKVGILHDSPISAADHLEQVWEKIELWWNSYDTQKVIKEFVKTYCFRPPNLIDEMVKKVEEITLKS